MSANAVIRSINGVGTPRILTETDVLFQSSTSTVYNSAGLSIGGSPNLSSILAGMRISSFTVIAGQPNKPTYGRVTLVDDINDVIGVDAWSPTTPTNGQIFTIDGWVIDLPHCQEITETFEADQNVHKLWRERIVTKFFGWKYSCTLDYSRYIKPDTIVDARYMLSKDTNHSMVLIPHKDKPEFQYNVMFDQPISMSPFGIAPGYRKFVLSFRGRESVAALPIAATGYGFGYATNYGVQL